MKSGKETWKRRIRNEVTLNIVKFSIEAYLSVDWHDFVVVQTVDFNDSDDPLEFNQPLTLSMLVNYSESQKKMAGFVSGPQLQTKQVKQTTPTPVKVICFR